MISRYFHLFFFLIAFSGYGTLEAANTTVNVAVTESASEVGLSPGSFVITRTGGGVGSPLTVSWQIGTASTTDKTIASLDYTVSGTTGTSTILAGQSSVTVTLTPKPDSDIEGRETVILELIDTPNYDLGSDLSATMIIADDDVTVQLASALPTTYESSPTQPGRFRASFSPTTTRAFSTDLIARLSTTATPGHAVKGNDYSVTYRVGGSDPSAGINYTVLPRYAYQAGATQIAVSGGSTSIPTDAHITFAGVTGTYDSISGLSGISGILTVVRTGVSPGTGLAAGLPNGTALTITLSAITGFNTSQAHTSGQTQINVIGGSRSIPAGSTITFAGSDTTNYVSINGLNALTGTLTITPALTQNLAINSAMTITPLLINNFVVNLANNEPIGSTTLKLSGGTGTFAAGDLFRIGTGTTQMYLVSDWDNITKVITFARFPEGGGIPSAITTTPAIVTVFPAEYTGSDANEIAIKVPGTSSHIDYFITPIDDSVVEGEEVLNMSLVYNPDVAFANASANMRIADNDATIEFTPSGNVDATKGGNDGSFLLTVTPSTGFPSNVQISYEIKAAPDTTADSDTDYVTLGTFEFPARTATTTIPIRALSGGTTSNTVLTLGLKPTNDYRVAGSSLSSVSINHSQGLVSIAAKTGFEVGAERLISATQVPAKFTVTLSDPATTDLNIVYSLPVPLLSPATPGIDYSITGANNTLRIGQVTILSGTRTADIVVNPIDDTTPELPEVVTITLASGFGYIVDSTKATASVGIIDDEPVVSITKTNDLDETGLDVIVFTVTAAVAAPRDTDIDLTYLTGTAVAADHTAPATVKLLKDATSVVVRFNAKIDHVVEGDETIIATITDKPSAYLRGTTQTATATISDTRPVFTLVADTMAVENGTVGKFKITSTPAPVTPITVAYTVATTSTASPGAAVGTGIDYRTLTNSVTVAANTADTYIDVQAFTDSIYDPNETVIITLTDKATPDFSHAGTTALTATLTIQDAELGVTSVTSNKADGSYTIGEVFNIAVVFSSPVAVTGSPTLTLETGSSDAVATFVNRSPTNTLNFTYAVRATDLSANLDYVSTSALALNGGSILLLASPFSTARLDLPAPNSLHSLGKGRVRVIDGGNTSGKPVPGAVGSANGGGCGLGSSFAALAALCMLAGMMVSMRRIRR